MSEGVLPEKLTSGAEEWRALLADDVETITRILHEMRRIAVIGIKPRDAGGPAYAVPAWLQQQGYDIVPVPVYYPDLTEILGEPVHRTLDSVTPPADLIQIFRRSVDVPRHLDELLRARPRVVWMQLGIHHREVAEQLAQAGIHVIQNRCLQVELQHRVR